MLLKLKRAVCGGLTNAEIRYQAGSSRCQSLSQLVAIVYGRSNTNKLNAINCYIDMHTLEKTRQTK